MVGDEWALDWTEAERFGSGFGHFICIGMVPLGAVFSF